MAEITILIATQDNLDSLRLTVESLRFHNPDVDFLLWIWDNNSTDGAQQWARDHADRLFIKDEYLGDHHGIPLDRMCQLVQTPYVLTLDNDVRTTAPFLARMLEEIRTTNAFAVSPKSRFPMGSVDHHGQTLFGQPRIDPCCSLFDTHRLAKMTRSVSFCRCESTGQAKFYDTGAMLRQAAEGGGHLVVDADWLWDCIHHYGAMTWAGYAPDETPTKATHSKRMARLRSHLVELDQTLRAASELVVAHYQEDLRWLDTIPMRKYTVYDKSTVSPGGRPLPNVGREAHTYAHHVMANYDNLAEVTAFVQGRPFDHAPEILDRLGVMTAGFQFLGQHRFMTGPDGDASHKNLPVGQFFHELTGMLLPAEPVFSPGACFMAHRSVLQRYPKAWWARLTARLAAPDTQTWAPWVMERLWGVLLHHPLVAHQYHEIPGWFTDHNFYRKMVREAADGAHFVEVGSWVGRSAKFMVTEIANSHKQIRFDAVDHFQGSASEGEAFMRAEAAAAGGTVRPVFERNMGQLLPFVNIVQLSSEEAARTYRDNSLDFVFIDAGHSEEEVFNDIVAWLPKVKVGGVLSGHDFSGAWPGVERAVRRVFADNFEFVPPMSWMHRRS